jgi:hypothetical protein
MSDEVQTRTVAGLEYRIHRYRPRIEGLFARIERWTNVNDPADERAVEHALGKFDNWIAMVLGW